MNHMYLSATLPSAGLEGGGPAATSLEEGPSRPRCSALWLRKTSALMCSRMSRPRRRCGTLAVLENNLAVEPVEMEHYGIFEGERDVNPVKALHQHGQTVWLDYLARSFIKQGELKTLIERGARWRRSI